MQKPPSLRVRYLKISGMVLLPLAVLTPMGALTIGWSPESVFLPVSRVRDSDRLLMKQMIELRQRTAIKEAEFMQRFARLPLDTELQADHLVTPEGRASGRATLNQLRALVAERAAQRSDTWTELRQIIAAMPDAGGRSSAFAGANVNHGQSLKRAVELDQSQVQLADAYEAVIDWCEGQGKRLTAANNQLIVTTPTQRTQLGTLVAAVRKAEQRENETVTRGQYHQQKFERDFDRLKKEAGL
jgi:antitoxin component of MazEF toxin-antitoxin module